MANDYKNLIKKAITGDIMGLKKEFSRAMRPHVKSEVMKSQAETNSKLFGIADNKK